MHFDTSKTLEAWKSIDWSFSKSKRMEFLTDKVHKALLEGDYFQKYGKGVESAVNSVANSHDELLISIMAGKLAKKLPEVHITDDDGKPVTLHVFDKHRKQLIAGALVMSILTDSEVYPLVERVEAFYLPNGTKKFRKLLYVQLGGSYENDLYKGIHLEPGVVNTHTNGHWRLTADQKSFLAAVASVPFCIWDGCTEELLLKGYTLKVDWDSTKDKKGRPLMEDRISKQKRLRMYADKIVNHVKKFPKFYFSAKYCGRNRVYYEAAKLEGMCPHGKLWETLMIDSAEAFHLGERELQVLKHIIYVNLHGRVSIEKAVEKFKDKDFEAAISADPMSAKTEDEFGWAILMNKAAGAILAYHSGTPSKFMFGYDFTNSGLMMAGLAFRSREMMKAGNLLGFKTVADSHTVFGKAFGLELPRKDIKKLHTALLHGGTFKTLHTELQVCLKQQGSDVEVTLDDVKGSIVKAYGQTVYNIDNIATWGSNAVGNKQNVLRWTSPDGFKNGTTARLKGCPVQVYVASAMHKECYTDYVITSDMPLMEDNKGFPVFNQHTVVKGVHYPVKIKKRGLYADITHSCDAWVLRNVTDAVLKAGYPILLKHDDYIAPPGAYDVIAAEAAACFVYLNEHNQYQKAIDEIAKHSAYYDLVAPKLITGNGAFKASEDSTFLMP